MTEMLKVVPKIERPDTPDENGQIMYDNYPTEDTPNIRKSTPHRSSRTTKRRRTEYREVDDEEMDEEESFPATEERNSNQSVTLTSQELEEWSDVIKMNDYLTNGRRPQFWEEAFTKRVMDAIKTKNLEMKKAAQLLGVSYGTLYGRYRETYGCLKHSYRGPFMMSRMHQNMWPQVDQSPNDLLNILQRSSSMQRALSSDLVKLLNPFKIELCAQYMLFFINKKSI